MIESIRGFVYRLIYSNTTNTYCVFRLRDYNDEYVTCTGKFEAPREGDDIELSGRYREHEKYGFQFEAIAIEKLKPDNLGTAKQYLLNLGVKGLGEKSVEKIIDYFGEALLELLKSNNPKEIKDVPGLRNSIKNELYNTLLGEGMLSELTKFFEEHGISGKWRRLVYTFYGASAIQALENNPYSLLQIANDITFNVVDTLASNLGLEGSDTRRIEAGISWILQNISNYGHTCLPVDELIQKASDLLIGYADEIADYIEELIDIGQICATNESGILYVYPPELYVAEYESVEKTKRLLQHSAPISLDYEEFIQNFETTNHILLGEDQKEAITLAFTEQFSLITGGPGTGKTTIIKTLVEGFQLAGEHRIVLCAPTGRAAKRLTEATDYEATTIHRLLLPVQGSDSYDFMKNEEDPLEADVVIIDEASMLNVRLYYSLLNAIPEEARIIIIGDVNQLPPIGAGFVLKDLLDSGIVPFTKLYRIYRQDSGNSIISNAYRINQGEMPTLSSEGEFIFIAVSNLPELMNTIATIYEKEKEIVHDELDLQIISPMRRGQAGSLAISKHIQNIVNPSSSMKPDIKVNGIIYRVGDKVIQVINNYELEVFNGDIGIIFGISKTDILIRFIHKEVRLSIDEATMIMPAYAITVHKSQGSEYGTVIIPFIPNYGGMLQRNLLYTAVTRAKNKVVLVGTSSAIERAVHSVSTDNRYTLFKERLQGLCD